MDDMIIFHGKQMIQKQHHLADQQLASSRAIDHNSKYEMALVRT
jgi:hypothetical protein